MYRSISNFTAALYNWYISNTINIVYLGAEIKYAVFIRKDFVKIHALKRD